MGSEDTKDMLKNVDWKTVGGGSVTTDPSQPVVKKRLPKKIRQVPECYFLPRRSLPSALAIYGAVCAAGVGAGMLLEVWINKKIKGAFLFYLVAGGAIQLTFLEHYYFLESL
ncbi:hypothetical protein EE612_032328 [Oryza sativa]|uniref:Uncharacterized protein n=2 Tax=Oryza TaxID=4527 RepID=B8B3I7_ORYSI|nr:hypothetical protein OsI_21932 [Oryza sativa Indica Group]KAB8101496.1 hypothetical protein EE612_032328 [Oryza sativa]